MIDQGKKHKHLTEKDRETIAQCLNLGMSFKQIGKRIDKDATTVSKEVKKHQEVREARSDEGKAQGPCERLIRAPFVCNGCKKTNRCQRERRFYVARKAHEQYRETLSESRTGIVLNKETFYEEDRKLTEAIKNGQHVYHAVKSLNLSMSVPSAYRYIHLGYMSCSKIDLPRAVKFKPRKVHREPKLPPKAKAERTYEKFLEYKTQEQITSWVEMDTVIGRPGGKTLLTFIFTACSFMFAVLLPDKTSASVSQAIEEIKDRLGRAGFSFGELMPVILTDNGGEFFNISAIENDLEGKPETRLFFCEAYHSSEKPRVEKNHTLIRDILPQGTSFDTLLQEDINLVLSHVNGVLRKGLHGKSAYDVFTSIFSVNLAELLGISYIAPQYVVQSPELIAHR